MPNAKYYVRHTHLPLEESNTLEFKGHRDFCVDDLKQSNRDDCNRPTRQQISKHVCGMLNTGRGGSIHCGVLDDGRVEGFMLSEYQKDHFVLNVQDTFSRFKPPLKTHMYSIRFVPIVENENEDFDHMDELLQRRGQNKDLVHVLRTTRFCWCDLDALASLNRGTMYPFYVIEVEVEGWDGNDPRNKELLSHPLKKDIYPIFTAEDGNVYIRRNATTEFMSRESVIRQAENMKLED